MLGHPVDQTNLETKKYHLEPIKVKNREVKSREKSPHPIKFSQKSAAQSQDNKNKELTQIEGKSLSKSAETQKNKHGKSKNKLRLSVRINSEEELIENNLDRASTKSGKNQIRR